MARSPPAPEEVPALPRTSWRTRPLRVSLRAGRRLRRPRQRRREGRARGKYWTRHQVRHPSPARRPQAPARRAAACRGGPEGRPKHALLHAGALSFSSCRRIAWAWF